MLVNDTGALRWWFVRIEDPAFITIKFVLSTVCGGLFTALVSFPNTLNKEQ